MSEPPNPLVPGSDFEFPALRVAERYRRGVLREFGPHLRGRVLEVGAGVGYFTALLRTLPAIEELLALDPEPRFLAELQGRLPTQAVFVGTVQQLNDSQPWDVVLSINVLEHVRDDDAELEGYRRRLRPGSGRLCLFVPARTELYAAIDARFGHHRRYNRSQLRAKLQAAGFRILRLHYFNFIGYFAWALQFRLLRRCQFSVPAVWFFDRVVFPLGYGLESRLGRPPLGQSLLCVAEAPA